MSPHLPKVLISSRRVQGFNKFLEIYTWRCYFSHVLYITGIEMQSPDEAIMPDSEVKR